MPHILDVDLGPHARAWFTGRGRGDAPEVGHAGNLSARRPHEPARLAEDRRVAFGRRGVDPAAVHLMRQVHGTRVAVVDEDTPPGAVLREYDAMVTRVPDRPLAVLVADCLPVLLAGPSTVAVAHAGRRGLLAGVLEATVATCVAEGDGAGDLRAVVGPAIHGCCYEVPAAMRDEVAATHPDAGATTTWGTPAIDLPTIARRILGDLGVRHQVVEACTACDPDTWFSHRADPESGRQAGVVVRAPSDLAA